MESLTSTPGVDSLGTQKFVHRGSNRETIAECVSIDFRKVLRSSKLHSEGNLSKWRDTLHALVALYNTCLPNITPELIYSTVCTKNSRSLLLMMSPEMALEDLCFRHGADKDTGRQNVALEPVQPKTEDSLSAEGDSANELTLLPPGSKVEESDESEYTKEDEEAAIEACPNCRTSKYATVYSDESESSSDSESSDSDSSSENSSDDEEQFLIGADNFLDSVHKRRLIRQKNIDNRFGLSLADVGIENRLIASITFEKRMVELERITYVTILSVRKKWRGLKLGQFLVQLVIRLSGNEDPLVVLADDDAIEFFEKQGFINDTLLCCKYDNLKSEGSWTNCSVMVRLPKLIPENKKFSDVENIVNKKIEKWQNAATNLYQQQVSLIKQLKNEIINNREEIDEQQKIIRTLTEELDQKTNNKDSHEKALSKSLLATRNEINSLESKIDQLNLESVMRELALVEDKRVSMDGDISQELVLDATLLSDRSNHSKKSSAPEVTVLEDDQNEESTSRESAKNDHEKFQEVVEMFLSSLKHSNPTLFNQTKVINAFSIGSDNDHNLCNDSEWHKMFFCGSILSQSDVKSIRDKGRFTSYHFTYGEYGVGLYFSRFAEVAMKFSKLDCVIIAAVKCGNQTSTVAPNPKRTNAGEGYDSLLTPGRLSCAITSPRDKAEEGEKCQELIVFDFKRAIPLHVVEYCKL